MESEEKLEEFLREHIDYEVGMLHGTRFLLRGPLGSAVLRNAVLESHLVHVRGLDAFLQGRLDAPNPRPDDVFVDDYLADWQRKAPALSRETRQRINKEIAHLTEARLEVVRKYWDIDGTTDGLLDEMLDFARLLPAKFASKARVLDGWQALRSWRDGRGPLAQLGLFSSRSVVQTTGVTCSAEELTRGLRSLDEQFPGLLEPAPESGSPRGPRGTPTLPT